MTQHPLVSLGLGLFLGVAGAAMAGLGLYHFYQQPEAIRLALGEIQQPSFTSSREALANTCVGQLTALGLDAKLVTNEYIVANHAGALDKPIESILTASLAPYVCPSFEMSNYCFGNACGESPMFIHLQYEF